MNRKDLARMIKATASYYGKRLEPDVLTMMCDDLSDLPLTACVDAYAKYRRDSSNRFFPLPAQIRDIISPATSPDDEAREAAGRIIQAIAKFGWCNESRAKLFVGSLGWEVVQRFGGWPSVCELQNKNVGTFQAQARDLAKSVSVRALNGSLDRPPELPKLSELLNNTLKKLE